MTLPPASAPTRGVLGSLEIRAFLAATLTNSLATSALATVVGFQVWQMTGDPLSLGWLGLVEAIPALGLVLFGGHVADRRDRRSIILVTGTVAAIAAVLLALIALDVEQLGVLAIYGAVFLIGIASGFERPALSAFEIQVIPADLAAKGASWAASLSEVGAVVGPAAGGVCVAVLGIPATYLIVAALLLLGPACVALIARKPVPQPVVRESLRTSLAGGLRYVFHNQCLVGSMALDLFAVLFGGAIALLPAFADGILHAGPVGLGMLRTAPSIGALGVMLVATRRPPTTRSGAVLLACVGGFGVSMLVFAVSTDFVLSFVALCVSGITDGVSMIIRRLIVRVMSPEELRGRISSVSWVFIGASNEIGAFESGVAASLLGIVPSVIAGAAVTLAVAGLVSVLAPELRGLDLGERLKLAPPGYVPLTDP
jgi:MFS family permease